MLCAVAFSSFVCSLILDLDPYGKSVPNAMFPLLLEAGGSRAYSNVGDDRQNSIIPVLSKVFEKIVAGKLSIFFLNITVCFLFLSFCIRRVWKHVMLCSHCATIYRLLWTGAWRKCLSSCTSQLHLIGLVTTVCCTS